MDPEERTAGAGLIQTILSEASQSSFFQLVRILELYADRGARVGCEGPASEEVIRFRPLKSLAFQTSDVAGAECVIDEHGRERYLIETTFLGLYGTSAPIPSFYTEELLHETGEESLVRGFLDIFNHRMISLFYRCWEKYRYYIRYRGEAEDDFSYRMFCLDGYGTATPLRQGAVPAPRVLRYTGLLLPRARPARGLEVLIYDYFDGIPTSITQFVARWVTVPEELRNRLGAANCALGESCHAGEMVMDRAGKFRLTLGPVGIRQFLSLLPHERNFAAIDELFRLYVTDQLAYEVEVILIRAEIPDLVLSDGSRGALLGQTTWLGRPAEDASVVFQEPGRDRWRQAGRMDEGRAAAAAA